ncbi:hypothetical protein EKO27_g7991 [Xylaria grammica]|uniref:DUF7587 domain-containing protein n=1 Tax=Xylaria grammica TaxID=363999 RepID=A0A439CY07_9PEZI|nr:hypothetical protein EKO27_g7991 [Xylaria grammica]
MEVPTETFSIPIFHMKPVLDYSDRPGYGAFLVKSQIEPHIKYKLWWTEQEHMELRNLYEDIPEFHKDNRCGGFVTGYPLTHRSEQICTCAGPERPEVLYRVVHDEQPHEGLKARGHGLIEPTPLFFQLLVVKHLIWQCRIPSPFLSATNSRAKVGRLMKVLEKHGCTGIRVVKFRSGGPGWDHGKQRLFHVPSLVKRLKYPVKYYMKSEYILESHIPPESIIETTSMEDFDTQRVPKKRKREDGDAAKRRRYGYP